MHNGRGIWVVAAALTAVIWPAVAVVIGHMGSFLLGFTAEEIAIQRAAVGLVAVVGGAVVLAPAYTLALIRVSESAIMEPEVSVLAPAAMGVIWPVWFFGIILAVPPLFGMGPEIGELLWVFFAIAVAARTIRLGAAKGLNVRRRWARRFIWRSVLTFSCLFVLILVGPAFGVRVLMGIEGERTYGEPKGVVLPLPENPDW